MASPAFPTANPALTSVFADLGTSDFAAPLVAPIREIDGMTGHYPTITTFRATEDGGVTPYSLNPNARPTDEPRPIPFSLGMGEVSLKFDKRSVEIGDASKIQWSALYEMDVSVPAMTQLRRTVDTVIDRDVFGTNYLGTAGNYGTSSDPGDFGTETTKLQKPAMVAIKKVRDEVGRLPNIAYCNRSVAHAMLQLDDVRSSVPLAAQKQTVAGLNALRTWFREVLELDLIIVDTTYDSVAGTQTDVFGDHLGIAYVSDQPHEPSFVNLFTNSQYGTGIGPTPSTAGVHMVRNDRRSLDEYIAAIAFAPKIVHKNAGYLLSDVLT